MSPSLPAEELPFVVTAERALSVAPQELERAATRADAEARVFALYGAYRKLYLAGFAKAAVQIQVRDAAGTILFRAGAI
jgi:hypothetical protein